MLEPQPLNRYDLPLMLPLFAQTFIDELLSGQSAGSAVFRTAGVLLPGALGVFLMLPRGKGKDEGLTNRWLGGALCTLALVLMATTPVTGQAATLFWPLAAPRTCTAFFLLAGISLVSAVMMITSRNPVYSALWFAMVLLANSGLYFIQGAEFLAASTIIIYAGAIIVTFLFVVMLAQPQGAATYDRRSREPAFTCLAGLLVSAALVGALHYASRVEPLAEGGAFLPGYRYVEQYSGIGAVPPTWQISSRPHVESLGKSLYLDHVLSVEVIGLLLLAAVVGAMLIAGHRIDDKSAASPPAS